MAARDVAARYLRASLEQELVRKVEGLLRNFDYAEAHSLASWFAASFPVVFGSRTPKGMKQLKQDAEWFHRLLVNAKPPVSGDTTEYRDSKRVVLIKRWSYLKDSVNELVNAFSNVKKKEIDEVLPEITVGGVRYINGVGFPKKKLLKWVTELNKLWDSVKGWRKKAVTASGGLTVKLARPKDFRGTVAGKYLRSEDMLLLRATPNILKRTSGSYGAPDYILIHELGHRYEHKVGKNVDFDHSKWRTTRYSLTEGEAFAELFALGHFGRVSRTGPVVDLEGKLQRFEELME